jgi:DNA topoisomerase-1
LDGRYTVMASVGHVRDLPKSKLGINIDKSFAPSYVIPKEKQKIVKELKKVAADASELYLATDPDREGEAISWHLVQAIAPDKSTDVHRVVFQEITKDAVTEAFSQPREIDLHLVNAQQARRVLDRLVGYKISPLLWKKVRRGLSAGRVQSAVLKMIVDRERQIEQFVPVEYWNIEADLAKADDKGKAKTFKAKLFGTAGKANKKLKISNKAESQQTMQELQTASFRIAGIKHKETLRQPAPPFITSTLQQEAWRKLKIDSKRTMALAQQLYEGLQIGDEGTVGLITYMRTDSTRVSAAAIADARRYITDKYGSEFVPKTARVFSKKSKGAQDAHEAIRPTSIGRDPQRIKSHLNRDQYRLYELIWKRMVASQMSPALIGNDNIDIHAAAKGAQTIYLLRTASSKVKFAGYLSLYIEGTDETEEDDGDRDRVLPQLSKEELLRLIKLNDVQKFTQPPPRYTE